MTAEQGSHNQGLGPLQDFVDSLVAQRKAREEQARLERERQERDRIREETRIRNRFADDRLLRDGPFIPIIEEVVRRMKPGFPNTEFYLSITKVEQPQYSSERENTDPVDLKLAWNLKVEKGAGRDSDYGTSLDRVSWDDVQVTIARDETTNEVQGAVVNRGEPVSMSDTRQLTSVISVAAMSPRHERRLCDSWGPQNSFDPRGGNAYRERIPIENLEQLPLPLI